MQLSTASNAALIISRNGLINGDRASTTITVTSWLPNSAKWYMKLISLQSFATVAFTRSAEQNYYVILGTWVFHQVIYYSVYGVIWMHALTVQMSNTDHRKGFLGSVSQNKNSNNSNNYWLSGCFFNVYFSCGPATLILHNIGLLFLSVTYFETVPNNILHTIISTILRKFIVNINLCYKTKNVEQLFIFNFQ